MTEKKNKKDEYIRQIMEKIELDDDQQRVEVFDRYSAMSEADLKKTLELVDIFKEAYDTRQP